MLVAPIHEIMMFGVFDRGVPNQERIIMRATQYLNLGQYGIMLGVRGSDGTAFPIRDNLFWYGDQFVSPNTWLFLYTGHGQARQTTAQGTQDPAFVYHWGKDYTVFASTEIVPILFRADAVAVLTGPTNVPQLR